MNKNNFTLGAGSGYSLEIKEKYRANIPLSRLSTELQKDPAFSHAVLAELANTINI